LRTHFYVLRTEFETRIKFNNDQKSPQVVSYINALDNDEITRLPIRLRKNTTSRYAHSDAPMQAARELTALNVKATKIYLKVGHLCYTIPTELVCFEKYSFFE
jgi:hypothetical protein